MSIEKLEAAAKEFEKLRNEMNTKAKALLQGAFEDVFKRFDQVKAIVWTQYTPYFNDGDACTFSVGEPYFLTAEEFEGHHEDAEDEDGNSVTISMHDDKELERFYDVLSNFMADNEDVLELMFGDHVTVKVTRDGVTTEEYEHH